MPGNLPGPGTGRKRRTMPGNLPGPGTGRRVRAAEVEDVDAAVRCDPLRMKQHVAAR